MTAERRAELVGPERGAALVVSLLVVVLLFLLGMGLLQVSDIESGVSANDIWTEGAFYAAEAGVQTAIDQITGNPDLSTVAIPLTELGDDYSFRSGGRDDSTAQPLQFLGVENATGFSMGAGTGYNESGYVNQLYQVNATGIGPRNALREVEVQLMFGPVAN